MGVLMFIDDMRELVRARTDGLQELMTAWEGVRVAFLAGRAGAGDMLTARLARRRADTHPGLFEQVTEALLAAPDDAGLDQRLQAIYHELAAAHGDPSLRERQERLLTDLESRWLAAGDGAKGRTTTQLERVWRDAPLVEERRAAWRLMSAPARDGAAMALEWLRLDQEAARAAGFDDALDEQGQRLGLERGEVRSWRIRLQELLAAEPAAAAVAEDEAAAAAGGEALPADLAARGALYVAEEAGDDGGGWAESGPDLLEALREAADLLGLEVEEALARWRTVPGLPPGMAGLVEGPEGSWPVVLLAPVAPGGRGLWRALDLMGRCLGGQAAAVEARREERDAGPAFPMRSLQARAMGQALAGICLRPAGRDRLQGRRDGMGAARGRRRRRRLLAVDLLRLEWLERAPDLSPEEAGAWWLELRRARLGLPVHAEDGPCWAADPCLALRPREAVARLAARVLSTSLLREWAAAGEPEPAPETGGLLLEHLTDPDPPEEWAEALATIRARLDPAALEAELGCA